MKQPRNCFECDGKVVQFVEDYTFRTSDGHAITVPDLTKNRCDSCGEITIPRESAKKIKEFRANATEQLTKEELQVLFDGTGLTQKDFAEALGLGEKTLHRWLKGTQVVSRSMGYYLRAMAQFPEVFKWVKDREWRNVSTRSNQSHAEVELEKFPALKRRMESSGVSSRTDEIEGFNPAKSLELATLTLGNN